MSTTIAATATQVSFADLATAMMGRGVRVIPLKEKSKDPWTQHAAKDSTDDLFTVMDWNEQQPHSNLGCVATNETVWLLDDDSGQVKSLYESETGLKFPDTFTVCSSGVKRHYYFTQTDASRKMGNLPQNKLFSARVHNQYVVGAGSIHPVTGLPYVVVNDIPIAPAPDELVAWVLKKHAELKDKIADEVKPPYELPGEITKGTRDDELYRFGCSLRAKGMNEIEILAALETANKRGSNPLKPLSDLKRITNSVMKKPAGKRDTAWKKNDNGELTIEEFVLDTADQIEPKETRWIWPDRIAVKLNMLVGNPDIGKGLIAMYLVACVTTGRNWYDAKNTLPPSEVLILSSEEDWDEDIVPRLMAAGADLSKVHRLRILSAADIQKMTRKERHLELGRDTARLGQVLEDYPNIRLVVIDPVSSYLGTHINMNGEQAVRAVLTPLKEMANARNVAVVGIMHLNKKVDLDAINRIGGAMAFTGVARMVWICGRPPKTEDANTGLTAKVDERQMVKVKGNIVKQDLNGLSYIVDVKPVQIEGKDSWKPFAKWTGTVNTLADDLMARPQSKNPAHRPPDQLDACVSWLQQFLKDTAKPLPEIYAAGKAMHGFSPATIDRSRRAAKIITFASGKRKARDGKKYDAYSCKLPAQLPAHSPDENGHEMNENGEGFQLSSAFVKKVTKA